MFEFLIIRKMFLTTFDLFRKILEATLNLLCLNWFDETLLN